MKKNVLVMALVLLSVNAAQATNMVVSSTVELVMSPFMTTKETFQDPYGQEYKQLLVVAKDDAAIFIASNGQNRGARLERALEAVRSVNEKARTATDMQIAEQILALK